MPTSFWGPLERSRISCFPELQPFPQFPSSSELGWEQGWDVKSISPSSGQGRYPGWQSLSLSLCLPGLHLILAGWQEEQRHLQARKAVLLSAEQSLLQLLESFQGAEHTTPLPYLESARVLSPGVQNASTN